MFFPIKQIFCMRKRNVLGRRFFYAHKTKYLKLFINRPYILWFQCVRNSLRIRGISKNRSSIFRGLPIHNSISLKNLSVSQRNYHVYQNDNYVGSNEIHLDAAHETIETQRSSHIKGSDKGVASWERCNIYIAPLTTPVTMRSVHKKKLYII